MLQREHSAILSTFINILIFIKIFVLSINQLPFTNVLLNRDIQEHRNEVGIHFFEEMLLLARKLLSPE